MHEKIEPAGLCSLSPPTSDDSDCKISDLEMLLGFGPDSPNFNPDHSLKKEPESSNGSYVMLNRMVRHKVLSREEEAHLFRVYASDDKAASENAYNTILLCNIRLVLKEVRHYYGSGLSPDDLFQEGIVGLHTAIRKFDLSRENRFSTYALNWIRQAMGRAVHETSKAIRIPSHLQELRSKFNRITSVLSQQLNRLPTDEEFECCVPNMTPEEIKKINMLGGQTLSMEANAFKNDDGSEDVPLGDIVPDERADPEEGLDKKLLREQVRKVMKENLSDIEYKVIIMRFGFENDEMTAKQVGAALGFPEKEVRRIEKKAKAKLANEKFGLDAFIY